MTTLKHQDVTETVAARFRDSLVVLDGSDCLWWTGAISRNAGHGRFWVGGGRVIVAHRYAYALAHSIDALQDVELLAHECDNPLCQRVGSGHVVASDRVRNRNDWLARAHVAVGNHIGPASSYERSLVMRNLLRVDLAAAQRHLAGLPHRYGFQPTLW